MAAPVYEKHHVVPDIIRAPPAATLQVKYPSGQTIQTGGEVKPRIVKDQPELTWTTDDKHLYTIIMIDPDVPDQKNRTGEEVLHWLVVNVPGSKISQGQIVAEFVGSGATDGSGLHRYTFLVYQQPSALKPDEQFATKFTVEGRRNFNAQTFAGKYKLGEPLAGNFYLAQYDDYVPELHKQLGFIR